MHRRSKDDVQWQEVKKQVDLRDGRICRCCSILLPAEVEQTKKLNSPFWMFQRIDHAHVLPVGNNLTLAYDPTNLYCLCRFHHTHIDNLINPITNSNMTQNEQWYWWTRIRFKKTWAYDELVNYEDLYNDMSNSKEDTIKKDVMEWW